MASYDFAALLEPVSESEPCGPDLDAAGDPDFTNFIARAEGVLPASFFTRDSSGVLQPFDRSTIDFPAEFKSLGKLLDDTRDLRLLAIYAKLLALNRDLPGFASCIETVARLVSERWADVNPRGDEGDFSLRSAVLQAFDEMPTIVLPLQYVPLADSRRAGPITFRTMAVANGEVPPRPNEPKIEPGDVGRAFEEMDLAALKTVQNQFRTIQQSAETVQRTMMEQAGYDQAVSYERLPPFVEKVLAVIDPIVATRDPDAAPADETTSSEAAAETGPDEAPTSAPSISSIPSGRIATMADASRALAGVSQYFSRSEPSNPAALLVRQAEHLVGKSFMEVMRVLVPARADEARILIGPDQILQLPLPAIAAPDDASAPATADAAEPDEADPIEAATRADAVTLLQQVGAFYRRTEPSSPIPLLTDRAKNLMERDFISILGDVLPPTK